LDLAKDGGTRAADIATLLSRARVVPAAPVRLTAFDPHPQLPGGLDKHTAEALLAEGVDTLSRHQERLYAHATWSVLIVFQAMDAAGKDGTIKHVMSGVNPQGVAVTAFKAPGPDDLAHDFLWRISRALPARGMIGIFNRSHYEEVLVSRVHPEVLARAHLPPGLVDAPDFWNGRLADIAAFETHLAREGTLILKFFLHVSREEQKRRFLSRLDEPDKGWKFDPADIAARAHWDGYVGAYEAALAATATAAAPWFVIPADRKWLMRLLVVRAINEAIDALGLAPVEASPEQRARFAEARRQLDAEP
jgi:PPK2 family polyphosphate:nucleotide phosphotransferase